MSKVLLGLSAAAIAATGLASAGDAKTYVCTRWHNGICVSTHRVKGTGTAPYATGYVFGPTYAYTPYSDLPQPVVSYYKLNNGDRYVYSNGYVYVVDPTTYAVTRVIDTFSH